MYKTILLLSLLVLVLNIEFELFKVQVAVKQMLDERR